MKIKKVDITGFRAYGSNGNGNFDFMLKSGEVADFVSIYAPNGFGKSSFYDAVEWALTNNISRFIREGLRQNNDSTSRNLNKSDEGQNILRNRYMPKSEESYVFIETTKEHIKKVLKPAQKGKRDFTFDSKSTDQKAKHLIDIFLSQDAIDAFLKEDKPETRYEKFMSHFGGNDEQYRLKLTILKKACFTQRTILEAELSEVNTVLQESLQTESLELANTTIRELNRLNESFDLLDHNFAVQDDIRLKNKLAQLKLSTQSDLDYISKRLERIDECKIGAIEFFKNRKISFEVNNKLNVLNSNLKFIETRSKSLAYITELEKKLSIQISELEVNQNLRYTYEEYLNLQEQHKNHKISLAELISGKQENEAINLSLQQIIKDLNASLDSNDILYREQIDNVKNAHAKYADLQSVEKEIVALEAENDKASKSLETIILLKHDLTQKIERVVNIRIDTESNSSTFSSSLYSNAEFLGYDNIFIQEFLGLVQRCSLLKVEIDSYSDEQQRLGSDQESIYKLITLAGDLISNSHQDSCPVCEQQYASHDALLKRINANIGFTKHQKDIASRKQKSETELYLINVHLKQKLVIIDDLKTLKLNALNAELSKTIDESLKIENENIQRIARLNAANEKLNGIKNTLHNLSFPEYLAQCTEKIDLSSQKKSELDIKLIEIRKAVEQVEISVLAQSSQIVLFESLINNIETSSSFLQMQNYFESHSISAGEESKFFSSYHETLINSITNIRKEIEGLKFQISLEEQNRAFSKEVFNKISMENEREALLGQLRQADESLVIFQAKIQFLESDIEMSDVTDKKIRKINQ
jgi:exonuclease SbcC